MNQFYLNCLNCGHDLIALTETNLMPGFLTSEIFDESEFSVFRVDRSVVNSEKANMGGVLIAISSNHVCEGYPIPNSEDIECVCVKATMKGVTFFVYCGYVPPDKSNDLTVYEKHVAAITFVRSKSDPSDVVLVFGDFNLPLLKWTIDNKNPNVTYPDFHYQCSNAENPVGVKSKIETFFCDNVLGNGLHQINTIANDNGRFLDLIFASTADDVIVRASTQPLVSEDFPHHKALEVHMDLVFENETEPTDYSEPVYDFKKAKFDELNDYVGKIDFESAFNRCSSVDDMVLFFYYILYIGFEWFVPKKESRNRKYPPWYNKTLRRLRNKKNRIFRRYCSSARCPLLYESYKFLRRKFVNYQNFLYREYLLNVQKNLKADPSAFFSFVKIKSKLPNVPSTLSFNNKTATNLMDICELYADFFDDVYKVDGDSSGNSWTDIKKIVDIGNISVTGKQVYDCLSKVKLKKSIGPDMVPPIVLRNCASTLTAPLCMIFNESLSTGVFPSCWKESYITTLFKSGSRKNAVNYRGVAILPSIAKVFESIVCKVLTLEMRQHISEFQHGFISGRSTSSNLVIFTNYVRNVMESGFQVDCIYTDFSKAFDRVQHDVLIAKLSKLGIHSTLLKWLSSYLTGRTQRVKIRDCISRRIYVRSGVPQGSHLGPLLFLLFINDVVKVFRFSHCLLFADDLKIFMKVRHKLDALRLQFDLNGLNRWCKENKLNLNVSKCFNVTYHRNQTPVLVDYNIDGKKLERKLKMKDLGVIFDTKVSFNEHVNYITSRAYSILGFIKRNCWEMNDVYALKSLYCCFVRSILEYASVVWNPNYDVHSKRIESVQKQFLLFALRKFGWRRQSNLPAYSSRCKLIDLESLRARRLKACALFAYDSLTKRIDSPKLKSLLEINEQPRLLRNNRIFRLAKHRTNYGNYEPVNNMCRIFNSVQHLYEPGISRHRFKMSLKDAW